MTEFLECDCICGSFGVDLLAMDERVYCTYIVASRSHTLYIGMTGNLLKKVFELDSAKFSSPFSLASS